MTRERRLHPRATVRLPARFRAGREGPWQDGLVWDLSAGGAGLRTERPLGLQEEVLLGLELPADEDGPAVRLEVHSLVVREGPTPFPESGCLRHAGLQFLHLEREHFERVRVFVWRRQDGPRSRS